MNRSIVASALSLICLVGMNVWAADVALTLNPDRTVNRVDEKVYGQFLEHIYHSCNGGLWGELVWDRSFEGGGAGVVWSRQDDCISQEGTAADVRLLLGEPAWGDYEFRVKARKTGGDEGFLILLRAVDANEFYWANLGGWGNAGHALERGFKGGGRWGAVTPRRNGQIEKDRWYQIRARCEAAHIQVWLDDDLVIDYTDDGKGPTHGRVGVGTWTTQAQFRDFTITALDGKTLFEGLPALPKPQRSAAPTWHPLGDVDVAVSTNNPLNGAQCMELAAHGDGAGLAQQPLRIEKDETYQGSVWLRGKLADGMEIQLTVEDKIVASQLLAAPTGSWQEMRFELKPGVSSDRAVLQIVARGSGEVWIDQVSVTPHSWLASGGCRPDLRDAIAALRPPVIRWPGGCFASPYRWKDGVGPQHKRGPHPRSMWDDKEVNSFGTDEFIAMCRKVGAEPLIVVNIGTPTWNQDVMDNDFMQEVLDWIEYCNGPADSEWGKVRAANGHPEPYGVKYWEIDNETWHMGAESYAESVNRFAPAMRKADPSIKLAACGSAGYGDGGNGLAWNRVVIDQCADEIDYLSIHHYESPDRFAEGPLAYERFFRRTGDLIAKSKNPQLKLYVSEWNAQSTDWRTGLYCGGLLNAFERCGDVLEIGGPALFLRHVSASGWDNAFVNFDHRSWFPAPNYVVMKLWREHYAPHRIAMEGELGSLNAVATRSEDGNTLILKVVNPSDEAVNVELAIGSGTIRHAKLHLIAPGSESARNTLDAPHAVQPESGTVTTDETTVRFMLPRLSCGVVEVQRQ